MSDSGGQGGDATNADFFTNLVENDAVLDKDLQAPGLSYDIGQGDVLTEGLVAQDTSQQEVALMSGDVDQEAVTSIVAPDYENGNGAVVEASEQQPYQEFTERVGGFFDGPPSQLLEDDSFNANNVEGLTEEQPTEEVQQLLETVQQSVEDELQPQEAVLAAEPQEAILAADELHEAVFESEPKEDVLEAEPENEMAVQPQEDVPDGPADEEPMELGEDDNTAAVNDVLRDINELNQMSQAPMETAPGLVGEYEQISAPQSPAHSEQEPASVVPLNTEYGESLQPEPTTDAAGFDEVDAPVEQQIMESAEDESQEAEMTELQVEPKEIPLADGAEPVSPADSVALLDEEDPEMTAETPAQSLQESTIDIPESTETNTEDQPTQESEEVETKQVELEAPEEDDAASDDEVNTENTPVDEQAASETSQSGSNNEMSLMIQDVQSNAPEEVADEIQHTETGASELDTFGTQQATTESPAEKSPSDVQTGTSELTSVSEPVAASEPDKESTSPEPSKDTTEKSDSEKDTKEESIDLDIQIGEVKGAVEATKTKESVEAITLSEEDEPKPVIDTIKSVKKTEANAGKSSGKSSPVVIDGDDDVTFIATEKVADTKVKRLKSSDSRESSETPGKKQDKGKTAAGSEKKDSKQIQKCIVCSKVPKNCICSKKSTMSPKAAAQQKVQKNSPKTVAKKRGNSSKPNSDSKTNNENTPKSSKTQSKANAKNISKTPSTPKTQPKPSNSSTSSTPGTPKAQTKAKAVTKTPNSAKAPTSSKATPATTKTSKKSQSKQTTVQNGDKSKLVNGNASSHKSAMNKKGTPQIQLRGGKSLARDETVLQVNNNSIKTSHRKRTRTSTAEEQLVYTPHGAKRAKIQTKSGEIVFTGVKEAAVTRRAAKNSPRGQRPQEALSPALMSPQQLDENAEPRRSGRDRKLTSRAAEWVAARAITQQTQEDGDAGDAVPIISDVVSLAPAMSNILQKAPVQVPAIQPAKAAAPAIANKHVANVAHKQGATVTNKQATKNTVSTGTGTGTITQHIIIQPPKPKQVRNKSLLCKPYCQTKATSCRPHTQTKETQTADLEPEKKPVLVPVPVPVYIPVPMAMYSTPFPYPVPMPVPIPVPCFIPTTKKSADSILRHIKEIQERMPADPFEAELLMMAEAVATADKSGSDSSSSDDEDTGPPLPSASSLKSEQMSYTTADSVAPEPAAELGEEDMLQMALRMASEISEEPLLDVEDSLNSAPIHPVTPQGETSEFATIDHNSDILSSGHTSPGRGRGRKRGRGRGRPKRTRYDEQAAAAPVEEAAPTDIKPALDSDSVLKYSYGVNAWRHWVLAKNQGIERSPGSSRRKPKPFKADILACTADELNFSLNLFVKEVRKPNGDEYACDSIFYLCLGIQQYVYENGRIDNIFTDYYYEKFTDTLNEILLNYEVRLNAQGLIVCRIEEEHLWESKQLGAHSPYILLNTLIYFNTKYFHLKSPDDHIKLSFSHIMKHWKRANGQPVSGKLPAQTQGAKSVYLRYYAPVPHSGPEPGQKRKREEAPVYEQGENTDNPLRCPVKLYEFYLSKCPESIKNRNDVFYLVPERSCVPDSPVWYSTGALGVECMNKMLNRLRVVREIQETYLQIAHPVYM